MLQPVSSALFTRTCLLIENILSGFSRFLSMTRRILSEATSMRWRVLSICKTVPSSVFVALPQASSLMMSRASENTILNAPTKMTATNSTTAKLRRAESERCKVVNNFFIGQSVLCKSHVV